MKANVKREKVVPVSGMNVSVFLSPVRRSCNLLKGGRALG